MLPGGGLLRDRWYPDQKKKFHIFDFLNCFFGNFSNYCCINFYSLQKNDISRKGPYCYRHERNLEYINEAFYIKSAIAVNFKLDLPFYPFFLK